MKPPSIEQIKWLEQSAAQTGNTEHKILAWLISAVGVHWADTERRLAALETAPQPQPAEPPADASGNLSRVAEAILDAFRRSPANGPLMVAAVIHALADQAGSAKHWHVNELRAIAAELEGGR